MMIFLHQIGHRVSECILIGLETCSRTKSICDELEIGKDSNDILRYGIRNKRRCNFLKKHVPAPLIFSKPSPSGMSKATALSIAVKAKIMVLKIDHMTFSTSLKTFFSSIGLVSKD